MNIVNKLINISIIICLHWPLMMANATELLDIKANVLENGSSEIRMLFSGEEISYNAFSLASPSSVIIDFPNITSNVEKNVAIQNIKQGHINELMVMNSDLKTRIVVNLAKLLPYKVIREKNELILFLDENLKNIQDKSENIELQKNINLIAGQANNINYKIKGIDFRRGDKGEGRLIIDLSSKVTAIDLHHDGQLLVIEFLHCDIPNSLIKKFDVRDFGTPMQKITTHREKDKITMQISSLGEFDKIAYQLDKQFIVEFTPLTATESQNIKKQRFQFTGEEISLNFQDIEVRAVLQVLADYTGMNMIASDTVAGKITLRLDSVPWDQALDYILQLKGLSKVIDNNILLIAPSTEIALREKELLEAEQKVTNLVPLKTEFIKVKYAKATDIIAFIKSKDNSLLSERGTISADKRTNNILLQDTTTKIAEVKKLLSKLDVPVGQVLIAMQLIDTTTEFTQQLGLQLHGGAKANIGRYGLGIGNNRNNARAIANGGKSAIKDSSGLFVDLSDNAGNGFLGLALSRLPGGTILDLELKALEEEGLSKTIANPKILTMDGTTASLEQGKQIPFTVQKTNSPSGGSALTTTEFKDALLVLEVTPQISPNNNILLKLNIKQDSEGITTTAGPTIEKKHVSTTVLVPNGDTIVIGGIFSHTITKKVNAIPFLHKLPFIGRLFKDNKDVNDRREIMIFVTPKIISTT